jgi:CheY-like chemotaxis protein
VTDSARPRILVIDDNRDHLEILRTTLSPKYEVATATDGLEGYSWACSHQPDAILLDIMMPVVDGYTVLRKLRANPVTQTIPIVLVTALDPDVVEAVAGDPVVTILRKPCHAGEVLDSLNAVLDLPDLIG